MARSTVQEEEAEPVHPIVLLLCDSLHIGTHHLSVCVVEPAQLVSERGEGHISMRRRLEADAWGLDGGTYNMEGV